jgi:4-amino-4-deoxy-L-arabinose transferase-like glycosyltransferase
LTEFPPRSLAIATLLLCALFVALGWQWIGRQSAAFDEPPMIVAGMRYRQGDLRWNREHPPLVKWLAAWTALERDPPLPPPARGDVARLQWSYGAEWLYGARQQPLALLASARIACLLLGALLVPLLVAGGYLLRGAGAGLAAALLVVSTPLWLAYSTLVNNDAAPALFLFASSLSAYRLIRARGRARVVWSAALALTLALGLAAKHTAIGFPLLILAGGCLDALVLGRLRVAVAPLLLGCASGQLAALLFAWGLPPRPGLYLEGLHSVGFNHAVDYTYYAFGAPFTGRNYAYFAYALFVKTPWPVWILALLAPLVPRLPAGTAHAPAAAPDATHARAPACFLFVLPPLGYLAGVSLFAPPIGVRYALPVLPYALLAAAIGAAALWRHARLRWLLLPLASLQLLAQAQALATGPLPWFNGFPCSTGQLDACLDDSNVDWGQALVQLREERDRRAPGAPIRVFYFGSSPLAAFIPNAVTAEGSEAFRPQRALYAVSLHFLVRIPAKAWVHQLEPVAIAGGSYAIYDLRAK